MAVEAHHLLHTGGGAGAPQRQQLLAHAGWAWAAGDAAACYEAPPARQLVQQQHQGLLFQHPCAAPPPTSAATAAAATARQLAAMPGQYAAGASESGVTFGGAQQHHQDAVATAAMAPAARKRKHAADSQSAAVPTRLVTADVAAHFQQQLVDVDRLVLQHMRAEMTEQRRRHAREVVAAVEAVAAKRLRAKDEEIDRISRLNWALEERVRSLYVEAQVWRDLAQSNEAAAAALRGELQQALDAQAHQPRLAAGVTIAGADDDDAESCCCGENDVAGGAGAGNSDEDDDEAGASLGQIRRRRACTMCGEGEAEVLMLPCRHLCACAACASAALACPACGCDKNGSVCVNFS
ncbi:hypothetical protein HU200_045199 [Digitaria exilis]|uniref:RING-type domain-containing protein n=1 Tax=Digitaria exilis TaxID=1010633 RepID=A0A835EFR2_9POAL|nr:hypothetical protein HU200_045199 [Digitaria exilis]